MSSKLSRLCILAVEDNVQAKNLLKALLRSFGVTQIFTAADGREAQAFLDASSESIDLILCDWVMPRMTGLELLQQVRMTHPSLPFMMITGNADIESVSAAKQFGVNAYICKPYSPLQLKRKLIALVENL